MTGIHNAMASDEVMPVPKGKVFRKIDLYILYRGIDKLRYDTICITIILILAYTSESSFKFRS